MKFMILVKATADSEAGILPSTELLTAMGKYNEELVGSGVMLAAEGLHPSSKGARVRLSGTRQTLAHGPFSDTNEVVAGYWIWECKSIDEAVEWVKRCPNPMLVDSEIEIRPAFQFEMDDFGAEATPEKRDEITRLNDAIADTQSARATEPLSNAKSNAKKFLVMIKATAETEAEVMPPIETLEAMERFNVELVKEVDILGGEGLRASSQGKRVRFSGAARTVVDGPFAKTNEIVSGFAIWQCASMDQALTWVKRFPNAGIDTEIEVRQIFGIDDFGAAATPEVREQETRLRSALAEQHVAA